MKVVTILTITLLLGHLSLANSLSAKNVAWKDMRPRYESFDQIKPTLVNESGRSIYLGRLWPDSFAQLLRFDESSGKWEAGAWGIRCGVVDKPTLPIEIKTDETVPIEVYWQRSMDDSDHPKFFVLTDDETKRPLNGKYKLLLRYALTPWTLIHHPKQIYSTESPEFTVGQ